MGKFFFSGSVSTRLDEKNRFVLPQEMRFGLVENGELEFALALGLGGCLAIYKKSEMEKIVEKFQGKQHLGKFQKFFTLFFSTLHQTGCDKIGRVHIPSMLKNAVSLKSEIVIAGVLNKIEIWPKDLYENNLKAVDLEEGFALLEEKGNKAGSDDVMDSDPTTNTIAAAAMNAMGKTQ